MSYFYTNSLHIKLEEERDSSYRAGIYRSQYSLARCSGAAPSPVMIPTRLEDYGGQEESAYTSPGLGYTLIPQSYMWGPEHRFLVRSHDDPGASHDITFPHPNNDHPESRSRKRRLPTVAQRRAANVRERRRMFNLNEAFDLLRRRVPTFAYEKRLSRIETLRLAISYIAFMTDIVNGGDPEEVKFRVYRNYTGDDLAQRQITTCTERDCGVGDRDGEGSEPVVGLEPLSDEESNGDE